MRIVMFCHSLVSCWNHGNAHFLRGVVGELLLRGHEVAVYEPQDGWSAANLAREPNGAEALRRFADAYPDLQTNYYAPGTLDLNAALGGADLAIVHEWSDRELVARIGAYRAAHPSLRLLFHDTHHRAVTDEASMAAYDLRRYDGVLTFGNVIRDLYRSRGWAKNVWTWHEAADTRVFRPFPKAEIEGDFVWIGNWGDEERTEEIHEFLIGPVRRLGLRATIYGVRYPDEARRTLADAGIRYAGYLPNCDAPHVFARHRVTMHIPRRPYTRALPGIPTIRVFEALACGIPLVSAPWEDAENLFTPGEDFLTARDGADMEAHLRTLLGDPDRAEALAARGLATVRARHTCAHRVDELLDIFGEIA